MSTASITDAIDQRFDLLSPELQRVASLGAREVPVAHSRSPYTRQTVDAVALARAQGASMVALIDGALSPIARGADHVLRFQAQTASFFHSTSGTLGLAELLIDAVYRRGGSTTRRRLKRSRVLGAPDGAGRRLKPLHFRSPANDPCPAPSAA